MSRDHGRSFDLVRIIALKTEVAWVEAERDALKAQLEALRVEVELFARSASMSGGFYCRLCDSPAARVWEDVEHKNDCPVADLCAAARKAVQG
jgi:Tfp pilus assembly protein PilW